LLVFFTFPSYPFVFFGVLWMVEKKKTSVFFLTTQATTPPPTMEKGAGPHFRALKMSFGPVKVVCPGSGLNVVFRFPPQKPRPFSFKSQTPRPTFFKSFFREKQKKKKKKKKPKLKTGGPWKGGGPGVSPGLGFGGVTVGGAPHPAFCYFKQGGGPGAFLLPFFLFPILFLRGGPFAGPGGAQGRQFL